MLDTVFLLLAELCFGPLKIMSKTCSKDAVQRDTSIFLPTSAVYLFNFTVSSVFLRHGQRVLSQNAKTETVSDD